jgi:hypothetical protein
VAVIYARFSAFVCFLILLSGATLRAQQGEPGQLDANRSLFTVMAALNAAGYDVDWNSPSNHPLRKEIRARVLAKNPPSLAAIKKFLADQKAQAPIDFGAYLSLGLLVNGPPDFSFVLKVGDLPPDASHLEGFRQLLRQFNDEADLDTLWLQAQPAIEQTLAKYQPPIAKAVFDANVYLRNATSGFKGRTFQVFVELQAPPNRVQTRTYGDVYIVVVSPSPEPQIEDIRRAYLHYLIDPMMMRYTLELESKKALGDFASASPILDDAYKNDFVLLAGMSLVRAIEARLSPLAQRKAMVDQAMSEGFILTGYFADALPAYEKDERTMRFYLGDMIKKIDLAKEDKRIEQVQFATKRPERTVKAASTPAPEPELTGFAKDLDTAESLYESRQIEAAKQAYRKVLSADAPRSMQARAYYGLARIAALEKDPELSEQLFEKTLQSEPEPVIQSWAHVYLARLALAAQQPDLARAAAQFRAALAVQGGSDKARAMAQKELEALSARNN